MPREHDGVRNMPVFEGNVGAVSASGAVKGGVPQRGYRWYNISGVSDGGALPGVLEKNAVGGSSGEWPVSQVSRAGSRHSQSREFGPEYLVTTSGEHGGYHGSYHPSVGSYYGDGGPRPSAVGHGDGGGTSSNEEPLVTKDYDIDCSLLSKKMSSIMTMINQTAGTAVGESLR